MKKWTAALLFSLSCALAGCAAETVVDDPAASAVDSVDTAEPASATVDRCCLSGVFTCPTNHLIAEVYDQATCGDLNRAQARAICAEDCGGPCVDSGYFPNGNCAGPERP